MSVYFATCREANAVKIGSSLEPHSRIAEMQTGCPLLIVIEAILPGGCEEEFTFHRRFEEHRIRGEWFAITEMIELIIAANPASPPAEKAKAPRERKPKPEPKPKAAKQMAPKRKGPRGARLYTVPHSSEITSWGQATIYQRAMEEMRASQAQT